MDFKDIRRSAIEHATPHWDAARQAREEADAHARTAREPAARIQGLQSSPAPLFAEKKDKTGLREEVESLSRQRSEHLEAEQAQRDRARSEQAQGDALYWSIFNLDRKNPHAGDDFEHLPPEQLADDILRKELRIAEIMREIKDLLARTP